MIIFIAALGALINRIRGGYLVGLIRKRHKLKDTLIDLNLYTLGKTPDEDQLKYEKAFNHSVFALITSIYMSGDWFSFVIMYLAMWAGSASGWGVYLEDMVRKVVSKREEVAAIDFICFNDTNYPVLRNVCAMGLRGLMWTTSLVLGFVLLFFHGYDVSLDIILLMPFGLLMGCVYAAAMEFCEWYFNKRGKGWQYGEGSWGFLLWPACFCLMGV